MKFDEIDWALFSVFFIMIVLVGGVSYDSQQQRALFQQTYNKNMECRQILKGRPPQYIENVCGAIPVVGDYVK
jgi:hypothetical protein